MHEKSTLKTARQNKKTTINLAIALVNIGFLKMTFFSHYTLWKIDDSEWLSNIGLQSTLPESQTHALTHDVAITVTDLTGALECTVYQIQDNKIDWNVV